MWTYLFALFQYFWCVMTDGDYLNDWLTHLPADWTPALIELGRTIAETMGV